MAEQLTQTQAIVLFTLWTLALIAYPVCDYFFGIDGWVYRNDKDKNYKGL
jgi:hypothetical protein